MEKRYIPRFYLDMAEKLYNNSSQGTIEINRARNVIGVYRFSRDLTNLIITDLVNYGLAERGKGRNKNLIKVHKPNIKPSNNWFSSKPY